MAGWAAVAGLLAVWGLATRPGPALHSGPPTGPVLLRERMPAAGVFSVWVRWDAPPGGAGWVVLEPIGAPWSPGAELAWRRRVHPGWNHLTWADSAPWPAGRGAVLRVAEGQVRAWTVSVPRATPRYGFTHLSPVRGFLVALGLATAVALTGAARGLRRARVPGAWALGVAAAAVLALWLRLHTLATQSFWFDEVLTAIGAQSLAWVLYSPQIFGHPPLQYVVGWLVGGPGVPEAWVRAPFVAAGVATVVALAALGRRLLGPATGFVAGLALAVSPFHVELSQLARPYAFFLLFSVLSLLALVRALEGGRTVDWLGFSALSALNLYTHYLSVPVLAVTGAVALAWLARRGGRGAAPALVSFAGVLVLAAPWVPVLWRFGGPLVGSGVLTLPMIAELVARVLIPQFLGPGPGGVLGAALVLAGLLALCRRPEVGLGLALWLLAPLALLWVLQPAHFLAGRHLAFLLPVLILLLAHGVTAVARAAGAWCPVAARGPGPRAFRLAPPVLGALLLVAWGAPNAEGLRGYYRERLGTDWRVVAEVLDRLVEPGDRVLATLGAAYPLRHYWRGEVTEIDTHAPPGRADTVPGGRVWVVTLEGWDDGSPLASWLGRNGVRVAEVPPSWSVPRVSIHWVRDPAVAGRVEPRLH